MAQKSHPGDSLQTVSNASAVDPHNMAMQGVCEFDLVPVYFGRVVAPAGRVGTRWYSSGTFKCVDHINSDVRHTIRGSDHTTRLTQMPNLGLGNSNPSYTTKPRLGRTEL